MVQEQTVRAELDEASAEGMRLEAMLSALQLESQYWEKIGFERDEDMRNAAQLEMRLVADFLWGRHRFIEGCPQLLMHISGCLQNCA